MIFEIGRVCVKLAGRDADQKCIVVDVIDNNFVIIDGLTRRRKCNVKHLEPMNEVVKIKKGADHKEIIGVFKKMGIDLVEKKPKKAAEKPKKARKAKVVAESAPAEKPKAKAAAPKKEAKSAPKKTVKKAPAKKAESKPIEE